MAGAREDAQLRGEDAADVVVVSREEYERLVASAEAGGGVNPEPAIEEGPHLKRKDVAEAKTEQLRAAKMDADHPLLTDDMRALLQD